MKSSLKHFLSCLYIYRTISYITYIDFVKRHMSLAIHWWCYVRSCTSLWRIRYVLRFCLLINTRWISSFCIVLWSLWESIIIGWTITSVIWRFWELPARRCISSWYLLLDKGIIIIAIILYLNFQMLYDHKLHLPDKLLVYHIGNYQA